jgi:hypothetical protein
MGSLHAVYRAERGAALSRVKARAMAADSLVTMGSWEAPSVDEGRGARADYPRARESENDCGGAETKAELCCDATKSIGSRCVAGRRSEEEEGVRGNCPVRGHLRDSSRPHGHSISGIEAKQ